MRCETERQTEIVASFCLQFRPVPDRSCNISKMVWNDSERMVWGPSLGDLYWGLSDSVVLDNVEDLARGSLAITL